MVGNYKSITNLKCITMTPNYKLLFEEAMALNSYLEFELDLAEEYALDLQIQLQACQNEDGDSDVATWGVDENGKIINMLAQ